MIISLCDRFHCLPSALRAEDAYLLQALAIVERAKRVEGGTDVQ